MPGDQGRGVPASSWAQQCRFDSGLSSVAIGVNRATPVMLDVRGERDEIKVS